MPYKLPGGQIVSDTDPNIEEFKKTGATLVQEKPLTEKTQSFDFKRTSTPTEKAQKDLLALQQTDIPDEEALRNSALKQRQGLIGSVNKRFDERIRQARLEGAGALGSARALASITGTLGSPRGQAQRAGVQAENVKVEQSIQDERQFRLETIFQTIDENVEKKITAQRESAIEGREANIEFLKEQATKDRGLAQSFISQGGDVDVLSDEDYGKLRELVPEMSNLEFDLFVDENKPNETKDVEITSKWERGNFIRITQAADGSIKTMTYTAEELGIMGEEKPINPKFVDIGGIKYFYDADNIKIGADGKPELTALGSTSKPGTPKITEEQKALNQEVIGLKESLDDPNNPMEWDTAFDSIKTSHPYLSNDAVNGLLGGSIEFNPDTGEFGEARGRAKANLPSEEEEEE